MENNEQSCVYKAIQAIGDKWTPLILCAIADGTQRFSHLQKCLDGITPRISPRTLSQRLDHLVQEGILNKTAFAEVPPRVEYTFTQKGKDLLPIFKQMRVWGTKY